MHPHREAAIAHYHRAAALGDTPKGRAHLQRAIDRARGALEDAAAFGAALGAAHCAATCVGAGCKGCKGWVTARQA
jgi:hypothetical protein